MGAGHKGRADKMDRNEQFDIYLWSELLEVELMDLMFGSSEEIGFNNQAGGCSITELGYG